jgi:hypothetical protein
LIKIQGDILYKSGKPSDGVSMGNMTITDEDRKWAEDFIKKQATATESDTNEKEYE